MDEQATLRLFGPRSIVGERVGGDKRPISRIMLGKKLYFLSVVFFFRRRGSASGGDLGWSKPEAEPLRVRSSLSQFPLRRASLPPTGQKTATRSSYAAVQFVNGIRSLVTDGAASRHTTSITTGFGSLAAAAPIAGRPLLSFRCFLFRTRISVW